MVRISVIMGIYNCSPTLAEALDSLLAQTYQGFKVIMCDDGSTDDTVAIAQKYVKEYPDKFFLIRNENNVKLAATLNHCLEYVDTEYVARMDGDDLSDPLRFETQIKFMDSHPEYSHVSSCMKYFDEGGVYGQAKVLTAEPKASDFKNGTPYYHAPTLFRKDAIDIVGWYTATPRVERVEDYYLWYKFHLNGLQGYNISEPLYLMRNDKNAFTRRKFSDRIRSFKVKIEVCKGLRIKMGILYALRDLSKGLVPALLIRQIIKYKNA